MSLETDIKQTKPFPTNKEKALVNLIYTNNWIYAKQVKVLKQYGLSLQQYNVLRILRGHQGKPITINAVIDRMLDKMSNASRLVDKLVLSDLAIRTENKADRRAVDVIISKKGKELLKTLDVVMFDFEEAIIKMSEEEAAQLSNLLDKFRGSND
jgi:DNA-binding MarR family transcriptional regulator